MLEVAVIGAGPAGVAAAIQLKIYGIDCIIFEQGEIGGLLRNANLVENYPGFPEGITGSKLIRLFRLQINRLGIRISSEKVQNVSLWEEGFVLRTIDRNYSCQYVVIATGTIPKTFSINGVRMPESERILTEIHPLLKRKNLHISIIGAGDAAFDYALNLSIRNHVSIYNRSENLKCLNHLHKSVMVNKTIVYNSNSLIKKFSIKKDHVKIEWNIAGKLVQEVVDYLILAIGREPNVACLDRDVYNSMSELVEQGKLFMIGDVTNGINRQTGISVGDGIAAAMNLNKLIKE